MDLFFEPFQIALDHWWQIGLAIVGCVAAICLADYFDLNRPWLLPVVLGGILSQFVMEAYPQAWQLGRFTPVALWVALSCMSYYLPELCHRLQGFNSTSIWDFFELVETDDEFAHPSWGKKGDKSWDV